MTISATRLHAADAAVTVLSNTASVTDWSRRYFGPWWNAFEVPATGVCTGPLVAADVDPDQYADLAALVDASPDQQQVTYAKAPTLVARDGDDTITAVSHGERLAYRCDPATGILTVVGHQAEPVALAAARLAREAVRGQLLNDGWAVLHASAVVREGQTLLTFGSKGAGKTTTALLLASRGWELLANDRVFVRAEGGRVRVLPWPAAAAIGLGLLDALGWFDVARKRLQSGEHLHPTQDARVTEALLEDRREPLWEPGGKRERKTQVFPDQFADWFGLTLSTGGRAAALLFPQVDADASPAVVDGARTLGQEDFMSAGTEDRYPDIFDLAHGLDGGGTLAARAGVAEVLAALPHHSLVMGHDVAANADFLAELTAAL